MITKYFIHRLRTVGGYRCHKSDTYRGIRAEEHWFSCHREVGDQKVADQSQEVLERRQTQSKLIPYRHGPGLLILFRMVWMIQKLNFFRCRVIRWPARPPPSLTPLDPLGGRSIDDPWSIDTPWTCLIFMPACLVESNWIKLNWVTWFIINIFIISIFIYYYYRMSMAYKAKLYYDYLDYLKWNCFSKHNINWK